MCFSEQRIKEEYARWVIGETAMNIGEHDGLPVMIPLGQALHFAHARALEHSVNSSSEYVLRLCDHDLLRCYSLKLFNGCPYKDFKEEYLRLWSRIMPRMPVYRKENFMQIMQKLLGTYKNGNYQVVLLDDGTKIRVNNLKPEPGQTPEDCFIAEFPESMDVCITHKCNMGCPMCYAGCTPDGVNADIMNAAWVESLHPFTECAVGGGCVFEHPDLIPFLNKLYEQNVIANITLNQQHFIEHIDDVMKLSAQGLVKGVGVSVFNPTEQLINYMKAVPNTVAHCIAGVVDESVLKPMMYEDLRLLLLGYKTTGRGASYSNHHYGEIGRKMTEVENMLPELFKSFRVVSFDNMALKQLHLKDHLTEEQWNRFYMGDDGIEGKLTSATMYVDMPSNSFAVNSMAVIRHRINDDDTVDTMFQYLKNHM